MRFRFSPFDVPLANVGPAELERLREVAEGWYVEYKSEAIPVKALAKSLSAFANQYGGWLILGVAEDPETQTAGAFPGVEEQEAQKLLQALRDASKDALNPEVYYETRLVVGPAEKLGLPAGRTVLVVEIPPGVDTPYVHNDGRVYRRVADSSSPKPETDRHILDRLWARGEKAKEKLENFVTKLPVTSKAEENECYLHLTIMSDPYEIRGDWYSGTFDEFAEVMRGGRIPFDNIYPRVGGFIARQAKDNFAGNRLFTWEFSRHCHSFVTFPVGLLSEPHEESLHLYSCGEDFFGVLEDAQFEDARVLDLNPLFAVLTSIVSRHRALVATYEISGPFYLKAHIENAWRAVPFLDLPVFIEHVNTHGIPVVQDENVLAPPGVELETFARLPERIPADPESPEAYEDALVLVLPIFNAFGIPVRVLQNSANEFLELPQKFKYYQESRNRSRRQ